MVVCSNFPYFLHCQQPLEKQACRFVNEVGRRSGTVVCFHHGEQVCEGKSVTALKNTKSTQKPGRYFSLGSARWSHSVRKVLQRAFTLQMQVQIVSHFSIAFPVSSSGCKGEEWTVHPHEVISNHRSPLAEIPKQQHVLWNGCKLWELPGRMTALQINTLFSACGGREKLFLLWLHRCSTEWWHLPQLCSLERFWETVALRKTSKLLN